MSKIALQANRRTKSKFTQVASGGGHVAPSFVAIASNVSTGTTSLSPGSPSGAAAGDLLIAWIGCGNGTALSMSAAGGQTWIEITQFASAGSFRCWYAFHNGSLGTVTMNQTNSNTIAVAQAAYRNVDPNVPFDTTPTAVQGAAVNTTVAPLTTTMDNVKRVIFGYFNGDRATNQEIYTAEPAGVTKRLGSGIDAPFACTMYSGDITQAAPGSSPSETFTHGNVFRFINHLALRPVNVVPGPALLAACQGYWTAAGYSGSGNLLNQGVASSLDLTLNGSPKFLEYLGHNFVWLPAAQSTNFMSAADNADYQATTALDLRVAVAADDWTPAAESYPLGQWVSGSTSWLMGVATDGTLKAFLSTNGTASTGLIQSTVAPTISNGALLGIRLTWTASPAEVKFWTKATTPATVKTDMDSSSGWTQLGSTITVNVPSTSLANSTSTVCFGNGLNGATNAFGGNYYYGLVSTDGSTRITFDPGLGTGNSTSWSSAEARTITVTRNTTGMILALVDRSIFIFDAVDDYFSHVDNNALDFTAADSFTVGSIYRIWGTPISAGALYQKYDVATNIGYVIQNDTTNHSTKIVLGDGTNFPNAISAVVAAGALRMQGGLRSVSLDQVIAFNGSTLSTPTTDSTTGTLANASSIELGRFNSVGFPRLEFIAAFVTNRTFTSAELGLIAGVWGL